MPYELGALIDSTRTITVHSALPSDSSSRHATLSAVALRPIVAKDPARARAFRETSIALQHVRHTGLLAVEDVVDVEARPVAITPLPPGAPLSRLLLVPQRSERRFGVEPSMRVVLDVARAAQVVHAARPDLRPLAYLSADTVWVTTEGRAVLLPSARCEPIRAGAKAPSWSRYRAPECEREGGGGESADVYSLAVLLWELLAAGKPKPNLVASDATGEMPAFVDPDVVRLVMRALSSDVSTRPRDPGAFAAELTSILLRFVEGQHEPGSAPFPVGADDEDKTLPGFAPSCLPDDEDEAPTIELPPATVATATLERGQAAEFVVVAAPVREAHEPATHSRRARGNVAARGPLAPKLKIVESIGEPPTAELCLTNEPRRWVVGRAASAHLVVADPDMSREHFAVMWEGEGRYRVRDLGSKNGLFVNGKAATDSRLSPGDEVRAGATRLRFET